MNSQDLIFYLLIFGGIYGWLCYLTVRYKLKEKQVALDELKAIVRGDMTVLWFLADRGEETNRQNLRIVH